ncbi:hypothetical protein MTR67_006506 [Solanum verrucosum]|uniref:Uncharacterized protein n=2 Tax=Solanum TaxID=4107 RepID=A0AAF0Q3A7_SOLVR|nr:hypothetical protein MTR67_006506 [Solanum verrucosum]
MATILTLNPLAIRLFSSNSQRYSCYLHRTMRIGQAGIHFQTNYPVSFMGFLQFSKRRNFICAVSKDAEESFKKTVEVDRLIDTLREASDKELPQIVVENVLAFNESFWIRLAARADTCKSDDDKAWFHFLLFQLKDYEELALTVMSIVDRLVHKTNEKIEASTDVLKAILKPVIDEVEEISWPLRDPEALSLMEKEINQREQEGQLDEGFLAEVNAQLRQALSFSSMHILLFVFSLSLSLSSGRQITIDMENLLLKLKIITWTPEFSLFHATKDGDKPGLEAMLQKVLQLYASRVLSKRSYAKKGNEVLKAEQFLETIIKAPEEVWNKLLLDGMTLGKGDISPEELYTVIKKRMERTLIRTEGGSYQQRVLIEYLKGIESRAGEIVRVLQG